MDCTNGCRRANHRSSVELFIWSCLVSITWVHHHHHMLAEALSLSPSLSCPSLSSPFSLSFFLSVSQMHANEKTIAFNTQKNNYYYYYYIDDERMTLCFQRPWEMWQGFVFPFLTFFFFPNDFCGCGNNLFDDMDKICVI